MATELIIVDKSNMTALADSVRTITNTTEGLTFGEIAELMRSMESPATVTYNTLTKTLTITTPSSGGLSGGSGDIELEGGLNGGIDDGTVGTNPVNPGTGYTPEVSSS